jgi:hypothetical protein
VTQPLTKQQAMMSLMGMEEQEAYWFLIDAGEDPHEPVPDFAPSDEPEFAPDSLLP